MPNERIIEIIDRLQRIEASEILSPGESALLDVCKCLTNEIQVLDAELSILSAGEQPIGCIDDDPNMDKQDFCGQFYIW